MPPHLQSSLENMIASWKMIDSGRKDLHWDIYWCELNADINAAETEQEISAEQAWYLREKSPTPTSSGGLKNAPKGSVTARLKGGCRKHILLAAAKKRLLYLPLSGILLTVPECISLWHPLLHFLLLPRSTLLPKMLYSICFVVPDACHIS